MRVTVAAVGRLKAGPVSALAAEYLEAANNFGRKVGIGPVDIRETPESRARDANQRHVDEASRLLRIAGAGDVVVALHEDGRQHTSLAFAALLRDQRDAGTKGMVFMIGGADGLDPALQARAGLILSLGSMTLPHGLARVVLLEQMFRAMTILAGHPYHRA